MSYYQLCSSVAVGPKINGKAKAGESDVQKNKIRGELNTFLSVGAAAGMESNEFVCVCVVVPVDVFSSNSDWSGFYEFLGKRQVTTVTVNGFNATTGRVNVTLLEQSGVQIKLAGKQQPQQQCTIQTTLPHCIIEMVSVNPCLL